MTEYKHPFSNYRTIGHFYLPQSEQQRLLDEKLRNESRMMEYNNRKAAHNYKPRAQV